MTDSQPLVCVFFQLPPSDQLFMRLHDIPWLVLLPQVEKLTYALEKLLVTNPSSMAMKTLIQARSTMGSKMLPIRDVVLSGRDFARHYVDFTNGVSQSRNLNVFVKEAYIFMAERAEKKIDPAQRTLSEFREELESVVSRITSLISDDNDNVSLFLAESSQIISVMIPAIEECSALLQEYSKSFQNIYKQNFNLESFDRNPASDAEFQLVREKWETLRNFLHSISADWNLLEARMENPDLNRAASDTITPEVRDATALTGIPKNPVNTEAPPERLPPKKAKIPPRRKFYQRISTCFSSKAFS